MRLVIILFVVLVILGVLYVLTAKYIGAAPNLVDEILEIMKPYLTAFGSKKIEGYLEEEYDYRASEIKMIKKKKGKGKYKYLYSLLDYIVDDNNYDTPYEFFDEAGIDSSSFSGKDPDPYEMPDYYLKKDEDVVKKIIRDMDLDLSSFEVRQFLKSKVYYMKVGRKWVPDIIPIMVSLWVKHSRPRKRTKRVDDFYVAPVRPKYVKLLEYEKNADVERDARDARERAERAEREARELRERTDKELKELRERADKVDKENKQREIDREYEYQREAFERYKRMWLTFLNNNPDEANIVQQRIDNGESEQDLFEEWVFNNPDIMGAREELLVERKGGAEQESSDNVSKEEAKRRLSNMLKNL